MSFNAKVKRRKWTEEEKHLALTSCGKKCACCGTKLTMKTLTMEHVVPISKGGTNDLENLVVLCKSCNSRKGDKFCWPSGYYMAMPNGSKLTIVEKYTRDWVAENITYDYVKEFPMVAETISSIFKPHSNLKLDKFIPLQLIFDIFELSYDTIGNALKDLDITQKDYQDVIIGDGLYSLIGVKGRTSDKVISLYAIQVIDDGCSNPMIFISEIATSQSKFSYLVPITILNHITDVYKNVGIYSIIVRNKDTSTTKYIMESFYYGSAKASVSGMYSYGDKIYFPYKNDWVNIDAQFAFAIKDDTSLAIEEVKRQLSSNAEKVSYEGRKNSV